MAYFGLGDFGANIAHKQLEVCHKGRIVGLDCVPVLGVGCMERF